MVTGYIYKIENKVTGHMYIGKTVRTIDLRWKQHCRDSKKNNYAISCAIRKHGKEAFNISVMTTATTNTKAELNFVLNSLEIKYIKDYNTFNNENYNLTPGGDGFAKGTKLNLTKEQLRRKSENMRGKNNPNYGRCGELSPTFGRKHSPETIEKLKGKKFSEEHCKKISESRKGLTLSEESKLKRNEAMSKNPPIKRKPHSEETKLKLSIKAKEAFNNGRVNPFLGKQHSEETKLKMRKPKRRKVQEVLP